MTDAELVLRARGGDELAFQRLADRYRTAIYYITEPYFMQGSQPEDLRQEGLFGLHKAARDYVPGRGSFHNFAWLCIQRQVVTAVKAASRAKHEPMNSRFSMAHPMFGGADVEDATLEEMLPDPASLEPHQALEERDRVQAVRAAVAKLTPLEQQAIIGPANGESYEEISKRTGFSCKQIDNARQRGKLKLARALEAA